MPRDKRTLTSGQWENLGSILGDYLWDQERTHNILEEYFHECGIPAKRIEVLADETFKRIEAGFARKEKS
jgi:hypothetical protein